MSRQRAKGSIITTGGKTTDGKNWVRGLFDLIATYGIPLDIALMQFEEKGMMPDWIDFYERSLSEGWNPKSTTTKLETAVVDVYGKEFLDGWKERFDFYTEHREKLRGTLG